MENDDITFVKLKHREIEYPVGNYITTNLQIIKDMSYYILQLYGHRNICLWCRGSSGAIIAGIIVSTLEDFASDIVISLRKLLSVPVPNVRHRCVRGVLLQRHDRRGRRGVPLPERRLR